MADVTSNGSLNLIHLFPDWSYLVTAPLSSAQGITSFVIVILGLVFFWAMGLFLFHQSRAKSRISFLADKLKDIQPDELILQREQIKQDMLENQYCSDLWNEFDESLVPSKSSENKQLHNTVDAAHFFEYATVKSRIATDGHR